MHQQRCVHAERPGPPGRDAPADFGQGISGCAILQQGMRLKVFSEVYCDRVYFLCAERFVTGSGFEPPSGTPPTQLKSEYPPPPPRAKTVWHIYTGTPDLHDCYFFRRLLTLEGYCESFRTLNFRYRNKKQKLLQILIWVCCLFSLHLQPELKSLVRAGIPHEYRARIWKSWESSFCHGWSPTFWVWISWNDFKGIG